MCFPPSIGSTFRCLKCSPCSLGSTCFFPLEALVSKTQTKQSKYEKGNIFGRKMCFPCSVGSTFVQCLQHLSVETALCCTQLINIGRFAREVLQQLYECASHPAWEALSAANNASHAGCSLFAEVLSECVFFSALVFF